MIDRKALAAALEDGWNMSTGSYHRSPPSQDLVEDAAEERLAQLPEPCNHKERDKPHGTFRPGTVDQPPSSFVLCPGYLYPPALVERIITELAHFDLNDIRGGAIAILDALNGEPA